MTHHNKCAVDRGKGKTVIVPLLGPHGLRDKDWLCGTLPLTAQLSFWSEKYHFQGFAVKSSF